jgi:hypothetical protein
VGETTAGGGIERSAGACRRASDRITRRAHTLSQLLEDSYSIRAADMPGADDLMMRIYAAMAQKERELISSGGPRWCRNRPMVDHYQASLS